MRIVVVGSVAAGTSVGAKARPNTEGAERAATEQGFDVAVLHTMKPDHSEYLGGNTNYQAHLAAQGGQR